MKEVEYAREWELIKASHAASWQNPRGWVLEKLLPITPLLEFSNILWNPKVQYRVHKSHPLVPILNEVLTAHSICLTSILMSFHLRPGLPSGLFPSAFPHKNRICISVHLMHITCPAGVIIFDLIVVIIFGEKCKLWSSASQKTRSQRCFTQKNWYWTRDAVRSVRLPEVHG
jgi:hypothetical protein